MQKVCEGRPEGISKGCAHAPLMVQEGLCLLCSHPHVTHLPAHPRVTQSAARQCQAFFVACKSLSAPRHVTSIWHGFASMLPACYCLCIAAVDSGPAQAANMTVPCTTLQDHYCSLCPAKVGACVMGITVLSTVMWACTMS